MFKKNAFALLLSLNFRGDGSVEGGGTSFVVAVAELSPGGNKKN